MKTVLPLVCILALSLTAVEAQAQPMDQTPMVSKPMGSKPMGPAQMAPRPMHPPRGPDGALPTPDYVRAAAQSDEFEIAEAKLALKRSHNPHIDTFARKMIHDHTQSTRMIKAALTESGHPVPPSPQLSDMQQQMIGQLRAAGHDFDKTYVDQQLQAHQMALATHQGYARNGTDPSLRRTAEKIVPVVQSHLQMLNDMQGRMG